MLQKIKACKRNISIIVILSRNKKTDKEIFLFRIQILIKA